MKSENKAKARGNQSTLEESLTRELIMLTLDVLISPIGITRRARQVAKETSMPFGDFEKVIFYTSAIGVDVAKYVSYGLIFRDLILPHLY